MRIASHGKSKIRSRGTLPNPVVLELSVSLASYLEGWQRVKDLGLCRLPSTPATKSSKWFGHAVPPALYNVPIRYPVSCSPRNGLRTYYSIELHAVLLHS